MSRARTLIALNSFSPGEVVELNRVLPLEPDGEWLPLIPAGDKITGRDGREWPSPSPETLLANQRGRALDIPIDVEHATEIKGPAGEAAPAQGWITDYKIQDGSLFGRTEWNQEGKAAVESRAYRYYSPAIRLTPTGEVDHVSSVGLTNVPNLALPALNSQHNNSQGGDMALPKEIIAALGLGSEAGVEDAVQAIGKIKEPAALNSQDNLVPRADYQLALNRAENAEGELREVKEADLKARAEAAVDGAVKNGKIAPASKAYHMAHCNSEEGLKGFVDFVGQSPPIVTNREEAPSGTPAKSTALTEAEARVAQQCGYTQEEALEVFGKEKETQS